MCSILKINKLKDVSQTEAALIRSRQLEAADGVEPAENNENRGFDPLQTNCPA